MNKNIQTIIAAAAIAMTTGCVTAGTWVNGCYIDGPLCTVCDGMKIVNHAYGATVCTHCDGTGIEPPEPPVVVENVVVDTWRPAVPPPPPPRFHHPRPIVHRNPPHHFGGRPRQEARPAGGRPHQRATPRPAARPARPGGGRARR